jgi:hypothetical protein
VLYLNGIKLLPNHNYRVATIAAGKSHMPYNHETGAVCLPVCVDDLLVAAAFTLTLYTNKAGGRIKTVAFSIGNVQTDTSPWTSRLCAAASNLLLILFAQFFKPF